MTIVCKSLGIWDGIVKPIYGVGEGINYSQILTLNVLGLEDLE